MTVAVDSRTQLRLHLGLVLASAAISILLLTVAGPDAFDAGAAAMAMLAATCIAVGDSRTRMLRNAWTGPFAVAAILHVLIASLLLPHAPHLIVTAAFALLVNAGLYTAMGLAGWVGFGDVKFVIGLTLFAALLVGQASMLLPLTALVIASAVRAVSKESQSPRPHGPTLVLGFALILGTAWLPGFIGSLIPLSEGAPGIVEVSTVSLTTTPSLSVTEQITSHSDLPITNELRDKPITRA